MADSSRNARGREGDGARLGHHLEDAAASAVEGESDRIDTEAARAQLDDTDAAGRRVGDLDTVAAVNLGERGGGRKADRSAQRVIGIGGLRNIDAGAAEGRNQARRTVAANQAS